MKDNKGLIGLRLIRKQKNLNQQKVALDLNTGIREPNTSRLTFAKFCPDLSHHL